MIIYSREEVMALTPLWKGERFPDGRPKVADRYLDALYNMSLEELWKPIFMQGYTNQFLAINSVNPEFTEKGEVNRKLVGRAVTAAYAPARPDYLDVTVAEAKKLGWTGTSNQWVIDNLVDRDVAVIDMYDKIYEGTFVGGNLSTAIKTKTGNGGAVIWGGIRDLEQVRSIPDIQVYYRGVDPTPIRDFVMTGMNCPVRLGTGREATICLPGDIVYGCSGGVLFIPAHLVADVVDDGAKTQAKDLFGFEMISINRFTTAEIDVHVWPKEMLDMLVDFIKNDPRGEPYRNLDWSREYELAENSSDGQSAL